MKDKLSITDDFPFNDYYKEYKKLGGNKTRIEYDTNLDIFIYHTMDIFVYGNTKLHNTRQKAIEAVINEADLTVKEYNLIFESVDNVTTYTWGFKMIRPEKYQYNWKPKTKAKEDLKLIKDLEQLVKDQNISKTQLTRKALNDFVKYNKKEVK